MSTTVTLLSLLLTIAAGCVNPEGEFDDFKKKALDAAPPPDGEPLTDMFDITGEFLVGLDPIVAPGNPFQFIGQVEYNAIGGGDAEITTMRFIGLDRDTRDVVPDKPPIEASNIRGDFIVNLVGTIPGRSNTVSGDPVIIDATLIGSIKSNDLFCGEVIGRGMTSAEIILDGSTFAGQRITPGTRGGDLPAVVSSCP